MLPHAGVITVLPNDTDPNTFLVKLLLLRLSVQTQCVAHKEPQTRSAGVTVAACALSERALIKDGITFKPAAENTTLKEPEASVSSSTRADIDRVACPRPQH